MKLEIITHLLSSLLDPTARKTIFFPDVLKRWSFQKKCRWNMIFLVLSRKMIFLFSENMILPLIWKMKDDLSHKNTWNYIFLKCSEKMVFWKRAAPRHDLSCIIWKDVFFGNIFFPWTENGRWSFSRNTWKYDIFCVHLQVLQTWRHVPLPKKFKDDLIP